MTLITFGRSIKRRSAVFTRYTNVKTALVMSVVWLAPAITWSCTSEPPPPSRETAVAALGSPHAAGTSRDDLAKTVAAMEARLARRAEDAPAAVTLADALLRLTRVTGNAGLAMRAEAVLAQILAHDPEHYQARRLLAAVYLSQHRFRDAIGAAERCLQVRADDSWSYGVVGDAHLELGDYDRAFAAFDRMLELRPDAAGYARVSYARELQGDLSGALDLMKMALEATSPGDTEALAWHHAQIGSLHLAQGRLADAARAYAHAGHVFPGHPFALDGQARVADRQGRTSEALALVTARLAAAPAPAELAFSGDLLAKLGRRAEADRQYRLAEAAWRSDAPEPARLAVFLADRGWKLAEALQIAEAAAADRQDIFTADAVAWTAFKAGDLAKARAASKRALRTGTRDAAIRDHARLITAAASSPGKPAQ